MKAVPTITDRIDLNVGKRCNQNCMFCYYRDQLRDQNRSLADLRQEMVAFKQNGIDKIHITGGEPLLHRDIDQIVTDAKDIGFSKISIITNGSLLRKRKFRRLVDRGVDEFIVSLHGHEAAIHDRLVGARGFDKTTSTLSMLAEQGFPFSINCVVTTHNSRHLADFARLAMTFKPWGVTFLYFNSEGDVHGSLDQLSSDPNQTVDALLAAADVFAKNGMSWDYKFVPLCLCHKTIAHCNNAFQALCGDEEWNYKTRLLLLEPRGKLQYLAALVKYYRLFSSKQLVALPYSVLSYLCATRQFQYTEFQHVPACRACSLRDVCPGVSEQYRQGFGDNVHPLAGPTVVQPAQCREQPPFVATNRDRAVNLTLSALSRVMGPVTKPLVALNNNPRWRRAVRQLHDLRKNVN